MIRIKICGMKSPENIQEIQALRPDYMGFIFYNKSPRYINSTTTPSEFLNMSAFTESVGVFVNAPVTTILALSQKYNLSYVQLHGDETINDVSKLKSEGLSIIKAHRITPAFNWSQLQPYEELVDYFLFDTAGKNYGGNGQQFNWKQLKDYNLNTPFFLSGGIGLEDIRRIKAIDHPQLFAIDINSKIEIQPGLKNTTLVQQCIYNLRNEY